MIDRTSQTRQDVQAGDYLLCTSLLVFEARGTHTAVGGFGLEYSRNGKGKYDQGGRLTEQTEAPVSEGGHD